MLEPLEAERAGEPRYDFLLGLSALNSGEAGLAVFALERVLAVQPDNARARAELGRAYFELRENDAAKQEFETVKETVADEQVANTVSKYLDALDVRVKSLSKFQWSVFVEGGGGFDSNVNAATSDDTIAIPALGGLQFVLADSAKAQDDFFIIGEAGGRVAYRLGRPLIAFAGASVEKRINTSEDADTDTADVNEGLRYTFARNSLTAAFQGQRFEVDQNLFRTVTGANVQW